MISRLVLFDLDGTLVDHEAAAATGVERWLTEAGWASAEEIPGLVREWSALTDRHFHTFLVGTSTYQSQRHGRLQEFLPRLGIDPSGFSDTRLDETFDAYRLAYEAAWQTFPDVVECLAALHGRVTLAVLSNGEQAQQEAKVACTGLGPFIDAVLTAELLGAAKPDPTIFLAACARLGVSPADTAYVGDLFDTDALAATAAGLRGIWLDRADTGGRLDVERVTTLADLPALLA